MLKGSDNKVVVIIQAKKALVQEYIFPKTLVFHSSKYQSGQRIAYLLISQETMSKALLCQSIKKVLRSNMHNF